MLKSGIFGFITVIVYALVITFIILILTGYKIPNPEQPGINNINKKINENDTIDEIIKFIKNNLGSLSKKCEKIIRRHYYFF